MSFRVKLKIQFLWLDSAIKSVIKSAFSASRKHSMQAWALGQFNKHDCSTLTYLKYL